MIAVQLPDADIEIVQGHVAEEELDPNSTRRYSRSRDVTPEQYAHLAGLGAVRCQATHIGALDQQLLQARMSELKGEAWAKPITYIPQFSCCQRPNHHGEYCGVMPKTLNPKPTPPICKLGNMSVSDNIKATYA